MKTLCQYQKMKIENIKSPRLELRYNLRDELEEINVHSFSDLHTLIDTIYDDLTKLRNEKTDPNERVLLLLLRRTLGQIRSKKFDQLEYHWYKKGEY